MSSEDFNQIKNTHKYYKNTFFNQNKASLKNSDSMTDTESDDDEEDLVFYDARESEEEEFYDTQPYTEEDEQYYLQKITIEKIIEEMVILNENNKLDEDPVIIKSLEEISNTMANNSDPQEFIDNLATSVENHISVLESKPQISYFQKIKEFFISLFEQIKSFILKTHEFSVF